MIDDSLCVIISSTMQVRRLRDTSLYNATQANTRPSSTLTWIQSFDMPLHATVLFYFLQMLSLLPVAISKEPREEYSHRPSAHRCRLPGGFSPNTRTFWAVPQAKWGHPSRSNGTCCHQVTVCSTQAPLAQCKAQLKYS